MPPRAAANIIIPRLFVDDESFELFSAIVLNGG